MKAAVLREKHFSWEDMLLPKFLPDEVLVKTLACGICGSDLGCWHHGQQLSHLQAISGHPAPLDWSEGVVLGHEFCAEIVELGASCSSQFKVGQKVCAVPAVLRPTSMEYVGFSQHLPGGFAQYMVLSQDKLFVVPEGVSTHTAALTEPLAVVSHAVNQARLQPYDAALVVGCGPIGLALIAVLKQRGVQSISVIEPVKARQQKALAMGATQIIESGLSALLPHWIEENRQSVKAHRQDRAPVHASPWVIFNCAGATGLLGEVMQHVPRAARIMQIGMSLMPDTFSPFFASSKALLLQFVNGYSDEEFHSSLMLLSEGRIDLSPMGITAMPVEEVENAMLALSKAEVHGKILLDHNG